MRVRFSIAEQRRPFDVIFEAWALYHEYNFAKWKQRSK